MATSATPSAADRLIDSFIASKARSRVGSGAARQLASVFDELPVPLGEWLASPEHMSLASEPLSQVQYDVIRHTEQIYTVETMRMLAAEVSLAWRPVRMVNFVWMMVGKGGGKDRVAALTQIRLAYLLACLSSPQRYLRIGSTSKIHMLNTASSDGQAEQVFFAELKGLLGSNPWFRGRYSHVAKEVKYPKDVIAISGNSKEESQEGLNLLYGCLDEIDAFRTKAELEKTARTSRGAMLNADGIFEMMRTSGSSRFPQAFKVLGLSWPRYVGSFIWTKVHEGLADHALKGNACRTFVVPGVPTWEANPTKSRADFDAEFLENPELANAKYACKPPMSESPYIRNAVALASNLQAQHPCGFEPVHVSYRWGLPTEDDLEIRDVTWERIPGLTPRASWQADIDIDPRFTCTDGFPRAIHVDTALAHDRCGVAMSHVRGFSSHVVRGVDEDGHPEETVVSRPLVTTDLITYFEAPAATGEHPKGEIELRWVRRLIFELIARGFPIRIVTYDGFQSADSLQLLRAHGVQAEYFSLDRKMDGYDTAKSVLYSGGLHCYAHPLLEVELKALTIVNGRKVDHPPGGSKDLADAWAGSIYGAVNLPGAGHAIEGWFDARPDTHEARTGQVGPATAPAGAPAAPLGSGGFSTLPPPPSPQGPSQGGGVGMAVLPPL